MCEGVVVGVVIAKGFLMIVVIVALESPAAGTVVADTAKAGSGFSQNDHIFHEITNCFNDILYFQRHGSRRMFVRHIPIVVVLVAAVLAVVTTV